MNLEKEFNAFFLLSNYNSFIEWENQSNSLPERYKREMHYHHTKFAFRFNTLPYPLD